MKFLMIVRRNLALFLKNKMNILLSFASIGVVLCLYVFFLRDFMIAQVKASGMDGAYVKQFTDRLMFSGLLPVVSTTTCFGIIQICVNDNASGVRRDYLAAPVRPFSLTLGYWAAGGVVSCFFTCLTMLLGEFYFQFEFECPLGSAVFLKTCALLVLSAFVNAAIVLLFAKGLKNTATFSTFANLYGTLIGFLAGSYLPASFYPDWLRPVLFFYPPAQLTSLCRQYALQAMKPKLFPAAPGACDKAFENFGVVLKRAGEIAGQKEQLLIVAAAMAVLLLVLCAGKLHRPDRFAVRKLGAYGKKK